MLVIEIVLYVFAAMELGNILALYFKPDLKYLNAIGAFTAWKKSEDDPPVHNFVDYLLKWVAGSKLIFVLLLPAIAIWGSDLLQVITMGLLIIAVLTFYWKMFPSIRKMDKNNQIQPRNYSWILAVMILCFILAFIGAFVYGLIVLLQN